MRPAWQGEPAVWIGDQQLPLASFGKRFGAWLIDALIVGAIGYGLMFVVFFAIAVSAVDEYDPYSPYAPEPELDIPLRGFVAAAGVLSALLIAAYWMFEAFGWSPGRAATGIRVIRLDGRRPGIAHGLVRYTMKTPSAAVLWLGYLWAAWDERHQTWHDKLAGTVVVRSRPLVEQIPDRRPDPLVTRARIWWLMGLGTIFLTASVAFYVWWFANAEGDLFDSEYYEPYRTGDSPRIEQLVPPPAPMPLVLTNRGPGP